MPDGIKTPDERKLETPQSEASISFGAPESLPITIIGPKSKDRLSEDVSGQLEFLSTMNNMLEKRMISVVDVTEYNREVIVNETRKFINWCEAVDEDLPNLERYMRMYSADHALHVRVLPLP